MTQENKILVGIDPDVDKSGIAIITPLGIDMKTLSFFSLFDYLRGVKNYALSSGFDILILVECGFLNKGNRHKVKNGSLSLNSKIGEHIGENHQAAKKIVEMCQYLDLNFERIRPTKTKLDASEFKAKTNISLRTNQEQRDAMMLIWDLQ